MKIFLLILALFLTASTSAAQTVVSEEWTTYCDGTTEKVRASITLRIINNPIFDENTGDELATFESDCNTGDGCAMSLNGTRTSLGSDLYRWTWEGFARDCFEPLIYRYAMMVYAVDGPFGIEYRPFILQCSTGPQTLVDNSECNTLPIAASTWGAIKALYR